MFSLLIQYVQAILGLSAPIINAWRVYNAPHYIKHHFPLESNTSVSTYFENICNLTYVLPSMKLMMFQNHTKHVM